MNEERFNRPEATAERAKAIERGRKLLALVERGDPGERDNAKRMLDALLSAHPGVTLDDLKEQPTKAAPARRTTPDDYATVVFGTDIGRRPWEHFTSPFWRDLVGTLSNAHRRMTGLNDFEPYDPMEASRDFQERAERMRQEQHQRITRRPHGSQ